MAEKTKTMAINVPKELLEDFKKFCEENSLNVSKRIRRFMESDIENWQNKKNLGN